jgi:hypothetical protein
MLKTIEAVTPEELKVMRLYADLSALRDATETFRDLINDFEGGRDFRAARDAHAELGSLLSATERWMAKLRRKEAS